MVGLNRKHRKHTVIIGYVSHSQFTERGRYFHHSPTLLTMPEEYFHTQSCQSTCVLFRSDYMTEPANLSQNFLQMGTYCLVPVQQNIS